jgi:hypothetical protein
MKDVYTDQYKRHLYNYKVVSFWISVANEGEKRIKSRLLTIYQEKSKL